MEETICFICRQKTKEVISLKSLDGHCISVCSDCQAKFLSELKEKKSDGNNRD